MHRLNPPLEITRVAGFVMFAYIYIPMGRKIVVAFIILIALLVAAGWALYYFKLRTYRLPILQASVVTVPANTFDPNAWSRAVETIKADRAGEGAGALEIPPELKHYEERYWFLATQVAEIEKYNIPTCQDYLDLAATLERGEMVPVAAVSDTYVL